MSTCIGHMHNEILVIEKNEILPFVTTWMDLESIMPSEISQEKKQILYDLLKCGIQKNKTNEQI